MAKSKRKTQAKPPAVPAAGGQQIRSVFTSRQFIIGGLSLMVPVALVMVFWGPQVPEVRRTPRRSTSNSPIEPNAAASSTAVGDQLTRYFTSDNLTLVWDNIKPDVRERVTPTSTNSNVTRQDFAGSDSCMKCHPANFSDWSQHPHRWMNALANEQTVKGDFSGHSEFHYRDGTAKFYRVDGMYRMSFQRGDFRREYEISQTIGSRFHQYYVGRGIVGPEPADHDYYHKDHVLPFGYWLVRQTWVPIVHVADELPDGQRWESVEQVRPNPSAMHGSEGVGRSRGVFDETQELGLTYASSCNFCHTTFPLADMFVRMPDRIGLTLNQRSLFELSKYVAQNHPAIFDGSQPPERVSADAIQAMTGTFIAFDARHEAAALGITCEACHLGCRQHAQQPTVKPPFAPQSPHLLTFKEDPMPEFGRQPANINAICGRCHTGERPTYAAGMATWNSTEHTDAMRGSCYSQLTCIDCHDPHKATGPVWSKTADQDDASCLRCHQKFEQPTMRQAHTRHTSGSDGDRCMNCHMPHINEGLQDVVRTHTIFSPTEPKMLAAGQPNACNLCHLDKSIQWTLGYLKDWYGKSYPQADIALGNSQPTEPVGLAWLRHQHPATRLTAVAAFARLGARWGFPAMLPLLDDPYLLNRQFAQLSIEKLLDQKLDESVGYWYHHDSRQRLRAIEQLRKQVP